MVNCSKDNGVTKLEFYRAKNTSDENDTVVQVTIYLVTVKALFSPRGACLFIRSSVLNGGGGVEHNTEGPIRDGGLISNRTSVSVHVIETK